MGNVEPLAGPDVLSGAERNRRGRLLLAMARWSLGSDPGVGSPRAGSPHPTPDREPWLLAPGATFVSLELCGELRGCIGTLEAYRCLGEDVRSNARRAAFADPRFPPLPGPDLEAVRIQVSVLGPLEELSAATLEDAAAELRPGIDGVVLSGGAIRATLLPQVWHELPEPSAFLAALARKAGIATDRAPRPGKLRFHRYRVDSWRE